MYLDILYFHSCGIVGIMMMMMMVVMIKWAHLRCLWIVRWMWALGFLWHSEEKTYRQNVYSRWGPSLCDNAVVSHRSTPWTLSATKSPLTTLHATGLSWICEELPLVLAQRPAAHQNFRSVICGWEGAYMRLYRGWNALQVYGHCAATSLALNPSVLIFSMATVWLV